MDAPNCSISAALKAYMASLNLPPPGKGGGGAKRRAQGAAKGAGAAAAQAPRRRAPKRRRADDSDCSSDDDDVITDDVSEGDDGASDCDYVPRRRGSGRVCAVNGAGSGPAVRWEAGAGAGTGQPGMEQGADNGDILAQQQGGGQVALLPGQVHDRRGMMVRQLQQQHQPCDGLHPAESAIQRLFGRGSAKAQPAAEPAAAHAQQQQLQAKLRAQEQERQFMLAQQAQQQALLQQAQHAAMQQARQQHAQQAACAKRLSSSISFSELDDQESAELENTLQWLQSMDTEVTQLCRV